MIFHLGALFLRVKWNLIFHYLNRNVDDEGQVMAASTGWFSMKKLRPHPSLATTIDCYWAMRGQASTLPSAATMFPLGYPLIEFNLGDGWLKYPHDHEGHGPVDSNILGFTRQPFRIQPLGQIQCAIVRLHPLALYRLVGTDSKPDMVLDPELVFGRDFRETVERIASSRSPTDIGHHLDRFFRDVFERSRLVVDYRVRHLLHRIVISRGTLRIAEEARDLGCSIKRIEQLFGQHMGMSPKAYAGIARFQNVLASYDPHGDLTTLSQMTGYYDQSHFIRQFKRFGGCPPKAFFRTQFLESHRISNLYNGSL